MKPVDNKGAFRISLQWEQTDRLVEIPEWTTSIDKHFGEFSPQVEHYVDPKNPKWLTKVSWDLGSPATAGTKALYWLLCNNDGRQGCMFWGGASALAPDGREVVALERAGNQRLRNKSGDWFKNLYKNHDNLAQALCDELDKTIPVGEALRLIGGEDGMGLRGWSMVAKTMSDRNECKLSEMLATCDEAILNAYFTPWMRPMQWASCWAKLRNLSLATQGAVAAVS